MQPLPSLSLGGYGLPRRIRNSEGEVPEHVPVLVFWKAYGSVQSPAADRGQKRRLDQCRIFRFGREGQFQEVKSWQAVGSMHGPAFGGDVVSRFMQPPPLHGPQDSGDWLAVTRTVRDGHARLSGPPTRPGVVGTGRLHPSGGGHRRPGHPAGQGHLVPGHQPAPARRPERGSKAKSRSKTSKSRSKTS
jgi:hypothetical protein